MWQRIQTVFLVIAFILLLAALILPLWKWDTNVLTAFYFLKSSTYQYFPYTLTAVLEIASATLIFIEITKYKNRLLQVKLGALNSLLLVAVLFSAFYFSNTMMKTYHTGEFGLGLWLPGGAVLCNLLANRFIRKDEKIVRDSDRIR